MVDEQASMGEKLNVEDHPASAEEKARNQSQTSRVVEPHSAPVGHAPGNPASGEPAPPGGMK